MTAALQAIRLQRSFGDDLAVDQLDLTVTAGEVVAIVGLNGAGKTTMMRLLLGMVAPDGGRALLHGIDVAAAPASAWRRVGHMVEPPLAWPRLSVRENLVAAARLHGVARDELAVAVAGAVERFGLATWADRRARELSLGNRQRLGLACALVHGPDVIVLDEPSNALDPAGVVFMRDLLTAEAARGAAILVSSHHLDELARIADRVEVLHRGRIVGQLDPSGVDLERRFFARVHAADVDSGHASPLAGADMVQPAGVAAGREEGHA